MDRAGPLSDLFAESQRVLETARGRGVEVRLVGGLAIRFLCPSAQWPALSRDYGDIDLAAAGANKQTRLTDLMVSLGYQPDQMLNTLNEGARLRFDDVANRRHVDVFVDAIRMCHVIEFKGRLNMLRDTLSPTDLLLTKLQIVELNRKDLLDTVALLHDHGAVNGDSTGFDLQYLERTWGNDWPLWNTSRLTLSKVSDAVPTILEEQPGERVLSAVRDLRATLQSGGKTLRWKLRAQVGERMRWYELPEDAG
jgi:hypothetical protein